MMEIFRTVREHVEKEPEKVILSSMGENERDVTFRELDLLSGKVCRYLKEKGIGREDFVNILLPRGVDPFIAMLGVWKAGAAFVLLEEDYPAERVEFIQKDCDCKLVLDRAAWEEVLACEPLSGYAEVDLHDAAFAVYTSGTTGKPKGVLHEYGNLDVIVSSFKENGISTAAGIQNFGLIAPLYFIVIVIDFLGGLDAGARMSVVPFSILKNPPALYQAFVEHEVDATFCAPSILRLFRNIPTLRKIFVGSEPANGIWSDDPEVQIMNGYCMSESAFCITMGHLDKPNEIAPIGRPFTSLKITLRDEAGNPVPPGEAGELCVENPYVRGYLNRPEETAKAFVNGELHTRDLARRLPDGQYEVLGRIDEMIKISGNRIEPAEIEVAVSRVSGLQQVVVRGFGEGEDAFICLYYADDVELDTEDLRKKLENVLPYYMIPSHFIKLDALPRTATGKISRRMLQKPVEERGVYVAPANDTERAIADAMASVLKLDRFSATEDFYRMGGSSVTSMEVVAATGLPGITINQIFRGRTPQKIAELYLAEQGEGEAEEGSAENLTRPCPLTQSQLGIFLECERHEGEAVYNNPMLFKLPADTDTDRMAEALGTMVKAHPGLFAAVVSDEEGNPAIQYQSAYAEQEVCTRETRTEAELQEKKGSLVQAFDLRNERLFRMKLIETEGPKYLFMDFHHLVFDGTSMQIMVGELERALGGAAIEPERWTAYDAAAAEQSARRGSAWTDARAWYLAQYGGADTESLPEGDRKEKEIGFADQYITLSVSADALRSFCETHKTTENIFTTAAFGYVLTSYTMKKEALFSTIYNGRRDPRTHGTVSMFVTTLPVLCRTRSDMSVEEYLSDLKEQLLGAMANDIYSFAELAEETGVSSEVQFAWQTDLLTLPKDSKLQLQREELPFVATGDAFSVEMYPQDGNLVIHVQYQDNRFSEAYIRRFAKTFDQVLSDMMTKERLTELSLLSEEEQHEILELSGGETYAYDPEKTWLDLFFESLERTPDKAAVTDVQGSFTYAELDRASDQIAAYLVSEGIEENSFLAIRMGRVKEYFATVLGIHKAGAAYVPIDLEYPEERVQYMLSDSAAGLLLTDEKVAKILAMDPPAERFVPRCTPEHLAYMIYTSGSTGKPKGVMIQHKALLNFVHFIRDRWSLSENSRIALHTNYAFDASVEDIFPALTVSGTVFIVPESARRDISEMKEFLKTYAINGGSYSTQFGQLLAADEPLDVDYFNIGGEAMTMVPKARGHVYNTYGPTEFTVDATYYELDKERDYRVIPIGRPLYNCVGFIMDACGRLLPRGCSGELCLAGPQLAKGYWNRPELTEERFPTVRIGDKEVRIYHTGDLARYNEEGDLEYQGRIDTQVKLRGFRIELGEIESTASRFEGIRLAAAEVKKDQLVLYYSSGAEVDETALRAFLAESLAEYMVPTVFLQMDDMPMTPNGKIDRKKLPEPRITDSEDFVEASTETEKTLAGIAAAILGTDTVSVTSDLVAHGLSSIGAMRFSAEISRACGVRVSVADIMKAPVIREIAALIDRPEETASKEITAYPKQELYPVTENQRGLFIDWQMNPSTTQYNIPSVTVLPKMDAAVLADALRTLIDLHPILKAGFEYADGDVMLRRKDGEPAEVEVIALEAEPEEGFFQSLVVPFDLMADRLYRIRLYTLGERVWLFTDIHHSVFDGISGDIFFRDLGLILGGNVPEPEQVTAYDYALYEKELMGSPEYAAAEEYFDQLLAGAAVGSLPAEKKPEGPASCIATFAVEAEPINEFCRRTGVTPGSYLSAAFAEALKRITREEKPMYATISNGRSAGTALQACFGMFVRTLPVAGPESKDLSAEDYVKAFHKELQETFAKEFYPYTKIVERTDLRAEILFAYQGGISDVPEGMPEAEQIQLRLDTVKMPIAVNAYPEGEGYTLLFEYDGRIYGHEEIERFAGAFIRVAEGLAKAETVREIALVSEEEIREILDISKGRTLIYDTTETWLDLFLANAAKTPEKRAVTDYKGSYTYAELDHASDRIAAYLLAKGVEENSFVAIRMHRVKEFSAAMIGIQKAGAAYVPIDPDYPEDRIEYMLTDSGSRVVLTEETVAEALSEYPEAEHVNRATPSHRAYMIYTSGSTGKPKGVVQTHRSARALTEWWLKDFRMGPDSVHAVQASFSFDASVNDLIPPLAAGGEIHILSEELRKDLEGMRDYFVLNQVNGMTMPTQIGMALVSQYPDMPFRYIMVGGEKMSYVPETKIQFVNGYGPTEFTVASSYHIVDMKKDQEVENIPIGRPVPNTWSLICDAYGNLMPRGCAGELCLAGPQIAEGYWRRQDITDERFVPCTFLEELDMKMYRTGDLARYNEDGELEYFGRIDTQVKLRGFRIELGEIEAVASRYPGISDAVAEICSEQLVLFFTADREIDTEALRGRLAESLTEYMVPTFYMQMDAMPITPGGKVDRKALRAMPVFKDEDYVAPADEREQKVSDLVKEVLSGRTVGVTSELQREGLTSIAAMRLSALISREFGKSFKLSDLKEYGTIRKITEYVYTEGEEETYELQSSYPLSSVQQGVYVECMANPNTTMYNSPTLLKLDPELDIDRLKQAILATVDAHPYMKMQLSADASGQVMALRRDDSVLEITEIEFSNLEHGFSSLVYPFRRLGESLFRISIVYDGENRYLFMDGHHIVVDGESMRILMRDINFAYAGVALQKENFTGYEAALLEDRLRKSDQYEKAKDYYTKLLGGIDTDCLPVYDRDQESVEIGYCFVDVEPEKQLVLDAQRDGSLTMNALWNAAFGLALSHFLYRDDCVYTTVYNGRNDTRLADSIGMFVHTLPVVIRTDREATGIAYAKQIGQQLMDSMSHDIYSFAEISRQFDVKANILFVYQGQLGTYLSVGGKKAENIQLELDTVKATLTINIFENGDAFEIACEFDSKHYEEWSIRALLEGTARVFEALLRDEKLGDISLVSKEEQEQLDRFNETEHPVEDTDIVTLFRRAASKDPEKCAVIFEDTRYTYRELDEITDRVAACLQEKGIHAEDAVSILIPRSEYMPVTALGVLKSGAAYQPLDPTYPPERLAFMVQDAGAKAMIVDDTLTDVIPDFAGEVLLTSEIAKLPEKKPAPTGLTPESLFILLYTSGTTGRPKGVMLTHGNLVNFCTWYADAFELDQDSTVAAYASFGFDACMMDMYPALTGGATLCIVPEDMRINLPELNEYYEKNHVTHVFMTTQMARMFATNIPENHLKYLMGGGEKLVPFRPEGTFRFYNCYGPTECTIFTTVHHLEENALRVPIGQPLYNYRTYVTGKDGRELPVGALGELWIAGRGVGRGYLNLPEQTEKAFIPNPFTQEPGYDRVYRTGDIVRRLPDGAIDIIGRNDGQVKIRGFRIELSEVEGVIRQFEGIKDATVQAFDEASGSGKFIAAYLVSDTPVDQEKLVEFIKSKKPSYMVPAAFMQIDEIPLNQNQKVNKRMLPIPEKRDIQSEYIAPVTPIEKEICDEFAKILGLEKVGATDDFFEIGGSSITAASVLTFAVGKGYQIVYKDIFDNPTPRKLAAVIAGSSLAGRSEEAANYDYTEIDKLIAYNSMENIEEISAEPVGDVVLAGATGFLGIHVLKEFLDQTDGRITCLMRKGQSETVEDRLKNLLMYYYGNPCIDLFGKRIFCLEGDITDRESLQQIDAVKADMIINCAACVKHFVKDDILDRINFHGVENLIEVCLRNDMRLVHVSTLSVGGSMEAEQAGTVYENTLYFGQYVDNDYARTKFLAERAILEARVEKGLDAVILRAGNLMGRYTDGEFQINFNTNAFMRSLAAFNQLSACPITALAQTVEFSPIDATAAVVMKLAGVNKKFSVFNINNNHTVTQADIIFALKRHGFNINIVTENEFRGIMQEAMTDEAESETIMSLMAYDERGGERIIQVGSDNFFTTNALYRLDFKWPIIDDAYLEKVIEAVDTLEFFNKI